MLLKVVCGQFVHLERLIRLYDGRFAFHVPFHIKEIFLVGVGGVLIVGVPRQVVLVREEGTHACLLYTSTIRIAGDDYPAEVVKSRFLKLDSSHIEYVLERMRENTTYVRNIKKYLLAALYNAPATIGSYYTSLVSHDLYGGGDRR